VNILMAARWPVGGIRTFFRYVYTQPSLDGCRVTLLAPGDDLQSDLGRHLTPSAFSVRPTEGSAAGLCLAIRRELRGRAYDLLHTHGLTAGILGQIARIGTRTPHLLTVHDVFLPTTFRGLAGRLRRATINRVLSSVDGVHAVGGDCAANFRRYIASVPGCRVHAITNGIDTQRFAGATPIDIRREQRLGADTALIGFFGRFMAPKGFRTLVDAVELLAGSGPVRPFRVITFGWGGFIREDYDYLRSKGLGEFFIQRQHTDEPERWMKGLDVVVMPSRWEACGLLAMEALAAGVPIVGSDCIGLREVLAATPARMVEPGNAAALAQALGRELEERRSAEFQAYSPTAVERFSVARNASALRSLYDELACQPV
jgi:glycosyltransferase involved in cell wall biosynthesis